MRFPLRYNMNMPFVIFQSCKYQWPAVNLKNQEMKYTPTDARISLYLPGDYNENISASWGMQDVLGGATKGWAGVGQGMQEALAAAAGGKIANSYSAKDVTTSYPSDILVFDSIEPIQLNFEFNMIPIHPDEAVAINQIISMFKRKSLPVVSPGLVGRMNFPDTWNIEFHEVTGLGLEMTNEYREMALIHVGVSYPSAGTSLLTYKDKNPVQTKLSLSFKCTRKHRIHE